MSNLNYLFANADISDDAVVKLMDGKLNVYKRPQSSQWQCRFKLANGKWHSASTNTADIEQAKIQAISIYETTQIKINVGLAVTAKTFKQIALDELDNMRRLINAGTAKTAYRDYEFAINKYLIPFFGKYEVGQITTELVADFEQWRISEMGKVPKASTKLNHTSAYNRVINLARERGMITRTHSVPMLDSKGDKGVAIDLSLTKVERLVQINGVSFEEQFIAKLIAEHLAKQRTNRLPTITDAFNIYIKESPSAHNWRFVASATRHFEWFKGLFGDLKLDELRHWHITQYRDYQLARGLNPTSIRKHNNTLNAMLNMAFKHLDIDRLSPFRSLKIQGEGEVKRFMPTVTDEPIHAVKEKLLKMNVPHSYVSLIQLNTGLRISEPVFAKLEHCVLEHDIPHLWVKKTEFCDRKTKSSIRAVPLYGVSLDAAKKLYSIAKKNNSEWFVFDYARRNGNTSCSAIVNKSLREFGFRSHMFRHAIIDRMKACNDNPTRLAESITGHTSGKSHFNTYGTVGYTLEQKLEVIKRVAI